MKIIRIVFLWISIAVFCVPAEMVYYTLDHVILQDGAQMTGIFSWMYTAGDFENGTGQFVSLDIPRTTHNQDDLRATFDIGSSIEITLTNNVDSDGVDISLFLTNALTATAGSPLDLARSKYDIGGDGFYAGFFLSGSISPTDIVLSIEPVSAGVVSVSWEPEVPGLVLQETTSLLETNWVNSASGTTNPALVSATAPAMFYRLVMP